MSLSNKKATPRRSAYEKLEAFGSAKPKLQSTEKVQAAKESFMKMATPSEAEMPISAKSTYTRSFIPSPAPFVMMASQSEVVASPRNAEQETMPSKFSPMLHDEQDVTDEAKLSLDSALDAPTPMSKVSITNAAGSALSSRILDFHELEDDVNYLSPSSVRSQRSQRYQEIMSIEGSAGQAPSFNRNNEVAEEAHLDSSQNHQSFNDHNQSLDHQSLPNESLDGTCVEVGEPALLDESITLGIVNARVYYNYLAEIESAQKNEAECLSLKEKLEQVRVELQEEKVRYEATKSAFVDLQSLQKENLALEQELQALTIEARATLNEKRAVKVEVHALAQKCKDANAKLQNRTKRSLGIEERYQTAREELAELRKEKEALDENIVPPQTNVEESKTKAGRNKTKKLSKEVEELERLRIDNVVLERELASLDNEAMERLLNDNDIVEEDEVGDSLNETIMMSENLLARSKGVDTTLLIEESMIM